MGATGDERAEFFVSGGTLPLGSKSYIERQADHVLLEHLSAGRYCYVLNARQMGKSSLCVRTMAKLAESKIHSVFVDLTQIGASNLRAEQWYAGLTNEVGESLDLTIELIEYDEAKAQQSPMQRFFGGIRDVVLRSLEEPLVIFVDEIDTTRNLPFDTDEFFAGIRECYNRRVREPALNRLTFCLIGVAVPNDLIRSPVTTPFNIGERIRVDDFTLSEVQGFVPALGANGDPLARRVHHWTNGQPLLTQSLCQEIVSEGIHDVREVDKLVERLFFDPDALTTNPNLADVANRALNDPEDSGDPNKYRADILTTYEHALRGASIPYDESNRVSVVLKLSGLMRADGPRLTIRNRIYRHVFDRAWIQSNMPGQELIRQRQSFWRGVVRGAATTAVACAIVGTLGLLAFSERQRAVDAEVKAVSAEKRLDNELYVSQMNSLRYLDETGNRARTVAVLERWKASPHRGFEWGYWLAHLHDSPEEYTFDDPRAGKQESGIVSNDGKQVCITDRLLDEIAIVDRQTKKVLGSSPLGLRQAIATDDGIVTVALPISPGPVVQLTTGRVLSKVGTPGFNIGSVGFRDHTNYVLLDEARRLNPSDKMSEVWDLRNGVRVCRFPKTSTVCSENSVSADCGRILYYAPGLDDPNRQLVAWDRRTGSAVDRFPFPLRYLPACLSASGRLLAYWDDHHVAMIRDLDAHKVIYSSPDSRDDLPVSVQIAPDDRTIVTVSSRGVATVREIPSGKRVAVRTQVAALTPGEKASPWIGNSSTVRLMDIRQNGEGIVGRAESVHRDGKGGFRLFAADGRSMMRIRDPVLTPLPTLQIPKGSRNLTYNGLWCLVSDPGNTQIVSIDGTQASLRYTLSVQNLASGVEGDVFVVSTPSGQYLGLSKSTGKTLWRKRFAPDLRSFWFSPDGEHLICATDEGKLGTIDPYTGKLLQQSKAHGLSVSCISFSADGKRMVTGGGDGVAILWDIDHLEKIAELHGIEGKEITGADISPDGRRIATCNTTGAWQLWDAATGDLLTEVQASILPLTSVLFTADGNTLVTAGSDGLVRAWRTLNSDPTVRIRTRSSDVETPIR